jgi:hypothetical protein
VVRLGHDPTDAYCLDGDVTDVADGVVTVWFDTWAETFSVSELVYDARKGVWRPFKP